MSQNLITKVVTSSQQCDANFVGINDRAATRAAIIKFIKNQNVPFTESSEWGAKPTQNTQDDWNYKSIAIHHAGNSFSCGANNIDQLKDIEKTDIKKFEHISYHYAIACDGKVYELLDIRRKGAHISKGNTNVIGIVIMADLTHRGEAYDQEYSDKSWKEILIKSPEIIKDQLSFKYDTIPRAQATALFIVVAELKKYFALQILGGHREFQVLANKEGRACPGAEGMKIVQNLRSNFSFVAPSSSNYPHI